MFQSYKYGSWLVAVMLVASVTGCKQQTLKSGDAISSTTGQVSRPETGSAPTESKPGSPSKQPAPTPIQTQEKTAPVSSTTDQELTRTIDDSPGWRKNIIATYFDISQYPVQQTAWNDVDPVGEENPYYLALPANDQIPGYWLYGPCKNRWLELVNAATGKRAFGQWEDVGPWFINDFDYVFDSNGTKRPYAELHYGKKLNIYRESHGSKGARRPRVILNQAGIDLSPQLLAALDIQGKGTVHWRFVELKDVEEGPWKEKISTTPPHYRLRFYILFGERFYPWEFTTTRFMR